MNKEPWQMTREEWAQRASKLETRLDELRQVELKGQQYDPSTAVGRDADQRALAALKQETGQSDLSFTDVGGYGHKAKVQQALSEGKPVPPKVLKDYPELVGKELTGEGLIAALEEKQFGGTIDRLRRGEITEELARRELVGDTAHITPKVMEGPPNAADFAAELKARGVERQESWSRWVQETRLKPGMDAKDWYKIYDRVTPAPRVPPTAGKVRATTKTTLEDIKKAQSKRTPHAIAADRAVTAKRVLSHSNAGEWFKHPQRYDIRGIDTKKKGRTTPRRRKSNKSRIAKLVR